MQIILHPLLGNSVFNLVNQLVTSMFEFKIIPLHNLISLVQDSEGLNMSFKHMNFHVENRDRTLKYKTVKYENVKYCSSPHYKAAKLWVCLPRNITDIGTITEHKTLLKAYFSPFDEKYFES